MIRVIITCFLCIWYVDGASKLYWIGNTAGIFSQFLQFKVMYHNAKKHNKQLVISPFRSNHYNNTPVNLCEYFSLPSDVSCEERSSDLKCSTDIQNVLSKKQIDTCYDGRIFYGTVPKGSGIAFMLGTVEIPFPLKFNETHYEHYKTFRAALGIDDSQVRKETYTVVHWRRGDQLNGRCKRGLDLSVNCGTAVELIRKVRQHTNTSLIYIATNEPQESDEMYILRSEGFITYQDVASTSLFGDLSALSVLAIEVLLMLDADKFLAWGLSQVNDVVEYERMQAGKAFCTGQSLFTEAKELNWCMYHNSRRHKHH